MSLFSLRVKLSNCGHRHVEFYVDVRQEGRPVHSFVQRVPSDVFRSHFDRLLEIAANQITQYVGNNPDEVV